MLVLTIWGVNVCVRVCVCLPYEQCVSVSQRQGACLWFCEGGVYTQALRHTNTHRLHTKKTHTWQLVYELKPCFIGWEFDVIGVFCRGGWGCSGHSHGWFCQAQDKSCTVGRSCLLQYPACLLVHPRWSRHQFQIFYRINSRRTRRVVTSRFPGNSLGGFHKVKLLNFPQPLCALVSPTFIGLWKWNHGARLSVLLSDSQEPVQCLHRSQQMLQNQNVLVWLIDWMDLLFDHFALGLGCSEQLFSIS